MQFQAFSLGLGGQWERVKAAYAAANRALGDIVKVPASSSVLTPHPLMLCTFCPICRLSRILVGIFS